MRRMEPKDRAAEMVADTGREQALIEAAAHEGDSYRNKNLVEYLFWRAVVNIIKD